VGNQTRTVDRLKTDTKVMFKQSEKQPFNFLGILKDGLTNSDSFEIVISVDEAIRIVLASIANMDKYIGEMKPNIDGSGAP
jgi:hypothetical protein